MESYLIMMRDNNVIAGGRSIQDNLLVAVYTRPPISPKYLIMLRHAEWLHGFAVLGFHTFNLQSGPIRNPELILSFSKSHLRTFVCYERVKAYKQSVRINILEQYKRSSARVLILISF